ncbi:glycosylphosphatidylinositol anchor biosynthesis protein 11 [Sergentomyia squamirostris]
MAGKRQESRISSSEDVELTVLLSIVSLIGVGISVAYLSYGDNLYSVGKFWLSPVLITLICNELGKYFLYLVLFRNEKTLNPRENLVQRKRRPLKHRLGEGLKFCILIGFFLTVYAFVCITLGAPVLENHEETLTLAAVLTILTIFPLAMFLGAHGCLQYLWTESLDSVSNVDVAYARLAKIAAAGALFGAWSGSIVAPLDWDRRWQVYPIPNIIGALLGYSLGDLCVLSQKLISKIMPSFTFLP